jgi:hypothetical protein
MHSPPLNSLPSTPLKAPAYEYHFSLSSILSTPSKEQSQRLTCTCGGTFFHRTIEHRTTKAAKNCRTTNGSHGSSRNLFLSLSLCPSLSLLPLLSLPPAPSHSPGPFSRHARRLAGKGSRTSDGLTRHCVRVNAENAPSTMACSRSTLTSATCTPRHSLTSSGRGRGG